jgi:structural maintenance of chromosome 1
MSTRRSRRNGGSSDRECVVSHPSAPELCTDTGLLDRISVSGTSEYRINGKAVSYKRYNEQLEAFNILVKAKNFLVFQGDVEAVASQSPKDLSRLVDQISGSLDLKEEYDRCATALAKATEQSVAQHARRKGVNSEVKQYQLMKTEAERWQSLQTQRADAVVHHVVWKLLHIHEGIQQNEEAIEKTNEQLVELREENEQVEETMRKARKEVNKAMKEVKQQDKLVKEKEKQLENAVSSGPVSQARNGLLCRASC